MLSNQSTILVIEDHLPIRRFLKTSLINQGFQYFEAGTGKKGLELAMEHKPQVILLDLGLPDIDGLEVIKELRSWTAIPIIILSARDQDQDKIIALDLGADDYLTKPFNANELNARLRVALRHSQLIFETETHTVELDGLKIDLINRIVSVNDNEITLSPIQFSILSVLARKINRIVTHTQLLQEVWGLNYTENVEYLRIYIHQLRHKLEENPSYPKYLKTEPGIGYRLCAK